MPLRLRPTSASSPPESLSQRLATALRRRHDLLAPAGATDACRLLNGVADSVPGLAVDRFADVLVAHLDQGIQPPPGWLPALLAAAASAGLDVRSVYQKVHPRAASLAAPAEIERLAPEAPLFGPPVDEVLAHEHGARYAIRPTAGLSVGLFLDMREVRRWVRQSTAGKRVLNLFAYTCAFGVCASLGGATSVLNLDVSRPYLAWGQTNYQHNSLPADPRDFVYGDAFDWLGRFHRRQQAFDLVILDPPVFGRAGGRRFSLERDYARLVEACARVLAADGVLLAATNHHGLSAARFQALLQHGIASANRRGRIERVWHEPSLDFPTPAGVEPYLKVAAVRL